MLDGWITQAGCVLEVLRDGACCPTFLESRGAAQHGAHEWVETAVHATGSSVSGGVGVPVPLARLRRSTVLFEDFVDRHKLRVPRPLDAMLSYHTAGSSAQRLCLRALIAPKQHDLTVLLRPRATHSVGAPHTDRGSAAAGAARRDWQSGQRCAGCAAPQPLHT